MRLNTKSAKNQDGMILPAILMISIFLSVMAFAIINYSTLNLSRARSRVLLLQAQYASESGVDATLAILNSGNSAYTGTASDAQIVDNSPYYKATFSVTVTDGGTAKQKYITSTGKVYVPANATTPKYTRSVEVYTERTSTSFASSAISRNILFIESGVKTLSAKDLTINGFVQMNKNTTDLVVENLTVAGKNTGAGNCSIGGSGNLVKPSSFINPGQTKTKLTLGYNNCISPPGNTSNADFDVFANQTGISQIQSTYIPWSEYMDASYSSGSCTDWTSGTFPRNIPGTGGSKQTHYPDSASGVDSSGTCGTSGNLILGNGQYNINDNVHIRANLCGTSGCEPTFYNPDSTMKWVFVEGTIKFNALNTAAGSGPIVFVSYGADPSGLAATCPYGGAIYLGNSSTSSASQVYLLSINGLCLDKTRFSSDDALGGISGKNVYISTNPGTPFDLGLDPTFPINQIPVDLSWKAVRYKRL